MLHLLAFAPHPILRLVLLAGFVTLVACVVVTRMRRREELFNRLKSMEEKLDRLAPK